MRALIPGLENQRCFHETRVLASFTQRACRIWPQHVQATTFWPSRGSPARGKLRSASERTEGWGILVVRMGHLMGVARPGGCCGFREGPYRLCWRGRSYVQVVGGHGGLDGRGRAVEEAHIPMIPQEAVDGLLDGNGGADGSGGERDGGCLLYTSPSPRDRS